MRKKILKINHKENLKEKAAKYGFALAQVIPLAIPNFAANEVRGAVRV